MPELNAHSCEPLDYLDISGCGGRHAEAHLALMSTLTRSLYPLLRSRGLDFLTRNIRDLIDAKEYSTQVRLAADTIFTYPTYDCYWNKFILRGKPYEPGLLMLLRRVAPIDFSFVDCGANFGFWSVIVTAADFGSHPCIAIEASGETYPGLVHNAQLNSGRFECLHRAVWSTSGATITFMEGGRHAGRHARSAGGTSTARRPRKLLTPAEYAVTIATVTIDDIASNLGSRSCLIKIDVEGAEIQAFDGATRTVEGDSVFIYEDHGSDKEHRVTRALLSRGFRIGYPLCDGHVLGITDASELTSLKRNRHLGYNFIAAKGAGPLAEAAFLTP